MSQSRRSSSSFVSGSVPLRPVSEPVSSLNGDRGGHVDALRVVDAAGGVGHRDHLRAVLVAKSAK